MNPQRDQPTPISVPPRSPEPPVENVSPAPVEPAPQPAYGEAPTPPVEAPVQPPVAPVEPVAPFAEPASPAPVAAPEQDTTRPQHGLVLEPMTPSADIKAEMAVADAANAAPAPADPLAPVQVAQQDTQISPTPNTSIVTDAEIKAADAFATAHPDQLAPKKKSKVPLIILAVVIVLAIAGAAYYFVALKQ